MPANPMDMLREYPVCRIKTQKLAFQDAVQGYAEKLGYPVFADQGSFGSCNLVIGDPKQAKYLVTPGSARSGVAAWLEIIRTFPENQRSKVCFVFFDGKNGASSYRKNHKPETDNQLLIRLDHVGDGTHMRMFPSKPLRLNRIRLTSLYQACGYFGSRDLLVEEKKKPLNLKICSSFPYTVTVFALQDHKKGMRYNSKTRDTALDETNVNILRAALTTLICCDEVN